MNDHTDSPKYSIPPPDHSGLEAVPLSHLEPAHQHQQQWTHPPQDPSLYPALNAPPQKEFYGVRPGSGAQGTDPGVVGEEVLDDPHCSGGDYCRSHRRRCGRWSGNTKPSGLVQVSSRRCLASSRGRADTALVQPGDVQPSRIRPGNKHLVGIVRARVRYATVRHPKVICINLHQSGRADADDIHRKGRRLPDSNRRRLSQNRRHGLHAHRRERKGDTARRGQGRADVCAALRDELACGRRIRQSPRS